jgi:hypothetical protein
MKNSHYINSPSYRLSKASTSEKVFNVLLAAVLWSILSVCVAAWLVG